MGTRTMKQLVALVSAGFAIMAVTAVGAGADEHRTQEPVRLIATGLDNPRHLAVNQSGRIYVAEAGRGGSTLVDTPLGPGPGPQCVGTTGAISKLVGGVAVPVIDGLPSVSETVGGSCDAPGNGGFATGPHGVDVSRDNVTYSIGLGGNSGPRSVLAAAVPEASHFGTVNSPVWRMPSMDVVAFEEAVNPDTQILDSNPYGVYRNTWRSTLVTDSGGNTLLNVHRNKPTAVLAVFAPRCVPWTLPFPNPIPPDQNPCGDQSLFPAEAVPTAVATAANGDHLVTTLGGFPFAPGYSRVWRVPSNHDGPAICSTFPGVPNVGCEVFADGLTALVDIDVAPDGKVYVVQFADGHVGALDPSAPETLAGSVQILHRRTGETMGSIVGLTLPGGIAIDYRDVFISNNSVFPGAGEVVGAKTLCTAQFKTICQMTRP